MKFGDKEWFEKLEKTCKFPSVFAFYVERDNTIYSKLIETKAYDLGNIQYKTLAPPLLISAEVSALASVLRCATSQDYYEECKRLKAFWNKE